MKLPEGYQTVMPYLILTNVKDFIEFTREVFGAKELNVYKTDQGGVMHAEIQIGGSTIMMGESSPQWGTQNAGLYINVENADQVFKKAREQGAEVVMDLENKEYGRTCGVKDPFGNTWWITSQL